MPGGKPKKHPLDVARESIRRSDSHSAALGWLRSATADRDYCATVKTAATARQALNHALEIDDSPQIVALLATSAEVLARLELKRSTARPGCLDIGDRITVQDCAKSIPLSHVIARKRVILHPEYLKIGRLHTIPAGCLDDIRKPLPVARKCPTWLHNPEMYARRAATHRAKNAVLEAERAEKIRAAYAVEADRRQALLERVRNAAPREGFPTSNGKLEIPKFEAVAVKEVERVNVETICKLTGLQQATASRRVKKHPKYKKIGIQNTIPLSCVDDIRDAIKR